MAPAPDYSGTVFSNYIFNLHNLYTTQNSLTSYTPPLKKVRFLRTLIRALCSCGNWIDKWNESQKQNFPKQQPRIVLNYRKSGNVSSFGNSDSGNGGSSTMEKIVEKLKKFGYVDDVNENDEKLDRRVIEKGSVEDIFYVEEGMLLNARGGFSEDSPLGVENVFRGGDGEVRFPWENSLFKKEAEERSLVRTKSRTSLAELTLLESELRRLRNLSVRTKNRTEIGGGGVTQAVTYSVPYALISSRIESLGLGQGLSMGILNLAITIPQVVVSLGSGPWDQLFGGGNSPALAVAAFAAFAGGILAIVAIPRARAEKSRVII